MLYIPAIDGFTPNVGVPPSEKPGKPPPDGFIVGLGIQQKMKFINPFSLLNILRLGDKRFEPSE